MSCLLAGYPGLWLGLWLPKGLSQLLWVCRQDLGALIQLSAPKAGTHSTVGETRIGRNSPLTAFLVRTSY